MKNFKLIFILIFISIGAFGQHNYDNQSVIYSNGQNVGIGTSTPLTGIPGVYNYGMQISNGGHTTLLIGDGTNYGGVIQSSDDIRRVFIGSNVYDDRVGSWDNFTNGKSAAIDVIGNSGKIRFITTSSAVGYTVSEIDMSILSDGSVGIGTESTGSHKLAVEGSIGAREIKVEASGWSDFVFEDNYELKSLEELEQYIIEKNHLPDVPTESEVKKEGVNLGEMNTTLLQKVEELTLYIIDQNKRMKDQNKRIEKLEAQNAELANKLNRIE